MDNWKMSGWRQITKTEFMEATRALEAHMIAAADCVVYCPVGSKADGWDIIKEATHKLTFPHVDVPECYWVRENQRSEEPT